MLLVISQLARLSQEHYEPIQRAGVCSHLRQLLVHAHAGVRARVCNLLGNICRHSPFFYGHLERQGLLGPLIARCRDPDRATRKFACFAIGNAGLFFPACVMMLDRAQRPPACLFPHALAVVYVHIIRTAMDWSYVGLDSPVWGQLKC